MSKTRNYQVDYSRYTFKADDNWGCYDKKGKLLKGYYDRGYLKHKYICDDGLQHKMSEHTAKWEYFNGKIPEGKVIDHIIPISNGGTNKLDNLRVVTQGDNNRNPLTRINHSEAAKLRKHTEETKRKMSEIRKGKPSPNKGKHFSDEVKMKMSESAKRYAIKRARNKEGKFCKQR